MKHLKKTLATTIITGGLIGMASFAIADKDDMDYQQLTDTNIQLIDAIGIANNAVSGQVVEAELEEEKGQLVWEIEILGDSNESFELEIDANSGEILSQEGEDDKKA